MRGGLPAGAPPSPRADAPADAARGGGRGPRRTTAGWRRAREDDERTDGRRGEGGTRRAGPEGERTRRRRPERRRETREAREERHRAGSKRGRPPTRARSTDERRRRAPEPPRARGTGRAEGSRASRGTPTAVRARPRGREVAVGGDDAPNVPARISCFSPDDDVDARPGGPSLCRTAGRFSSFSPRLAVSPTARDARLLRGVRLGRPRAARRPRAVRHVGTRSRAVVGGARGTPHRGREDRPREGGDGQGAGEERGGGEASGAPSTSARGRCPPVRSAARRSTRRARARDPSHASGNVQSVGMGGSRGPQGPRGPRLILD